jgi:putative tryptophan/tyrosine transport system substrate-binding protein
MKPGEVVFSIILVLALLVAPVPSDGQQSGKVYRIGLLSAGIPADKSPQGCPIKDNPFWEAFVEGLRERGYNQGQNLFIACRYTEAGDEHAPALAVELVRLKVDLLVAYGTAQALAAKRATNTLPIVMVGVEDPVRRGLVASLAHPGGTVTGPMGPGADFAGNYVHLLKETVPTLARLAVLAYAGVPWHPPIGGR